MGYFNYTLTFLNTLNFTTSSYTELDNYLESVVKNNLVHNNSFLPQAPTDTQLNELKAEIEASYDLMLGDIKPRYEEVLRLATVHTFRSKDTTDSVYGDEEKTGKYYEPVVSSAQAQVKTNGELTTWEDDKVTLSREEDRVLNMDAIKEFFTDIKEEVELYFIDYINLFDDNCSSSCDKPFTDAQIEAINSGITAEKVTQIGTNKGNITLLGEALGEVVLDLADKQDKLTDAQMATVNSGLTSSDKTKIDNAVTDVQIGETSIVTAGVATIPFADSNNNAGLVRASSRYGSKTLDDGSLRSVVKTWAQYNNSSSFDTNGIVSKGTLNNVLDERIYNENLLINGDFKINQRGLSSYLTANNYTVDRWKLVSGTLYYTAGGILLTGTITQTLENAPSGTLTASASGGTASYNAGVFTLTTTTATLITWAKLEVGEVATKFSPRPYAEELAMCQRYYQINRAYKTPRNQYNFYEPYLSFKTEMRTTPTVVGIYAVSGAGVVSSNSNTYYNIATNTEINVTTSPYGYISNYGTVLSNGDGTFVANNSCYCQVVLDAEIY